MTLPYPRVGWIVSYALLFYAAAKGETVATRETVHPPERGGEVLPGVFNTELPRLLRPEALRLSLRPHFGDFINHDHFRLTMGVRYGLTKRWELSADLDAYVSHGLGDIEAGREVGLSRGRLGAKYKFATFLYPYWETVAGVGYRFPIGRPPSDFTDGLHHLTPYMTLSHDWESRPEFTTFISYGVDMITRTSIVGAVSGGDLDTHTWFITPGLVWRRGVVDYSMETTLASSLGLDSRSTYRVTVRPGMKWTLPPQLTMNSRSQWIIGMSVDASYGSNGSDFGASARLQTDFDFRRLFKSKMASWVGARK